jgi:predicted permease
MWQDLAYSVRTLRRSPLFTLAAVGSLALGIGANTAIYSLLRQVVLESLPVRDPESLVLLHTEYNAPGSSSSDNSESVFSHPLYRDLAQRDPALAGVIARMGGGVRVTTPGGVEAGSAEMVSGNFFPVLGVKASLGRLLTPADDERPGAHPVAVLSHAWWAARYAASPGVLGQTIALNGHPFVIVGVTEPRFRGVTPGHFPDLYVPVAMQRTILPTMDALQDRRTRWLNLFARLRPGTSLQQAQAATSATYRAILESELAGIGRMSSDRARDEFLGHRLELQPAAQGISHLRRQAEKPLLALMALVGLVLLITCANVAGLMLARAAGRAREISIRLAMGAGRLALVRQLLLEGLLLAMAGGALGLAVARGAVFGLVQLLPKGYAEAVSPALDARLMLFALGVSLACGLLFGLAPALQSTRPDLASTLKQQSAGIAHGHAGFRQMLVVAQLALSLVLLVGAGLFSASLRNLLLVNLGFRTERLLLFSVNATQTRPGLAPAVAFYRDLEERLAAVPGVAGVGAAASGAPFSDGNRGGNLTVEGYPAGPDEYVGGSIVAAGPGFFHALRIPLKAGREFTVRDAAGAPKGVLVNEAFVRRYFAGRDPLGRRIMFGSSDRDLPDREIVGVVPDLRIDVRNPAKETVYLPYAQWDKPERLVYYIRAAGDERALTDAIRGTVRAADPNLPQVKITPLDLKIRDSLYTERLIAILSETFGVLATLLAAVGLYGVIAYSVTRRTPEIGIRMALGAVPRDVLRLVMGGAARLAAAGIVLGLGGAVALSRLVESQLFGVKPADPVVLAGAAAGLGAIALLAALAPGWRASRIDPVRALKYE